MEVLTRDDLETLMEKHRTRCISIFMPTHRAGKETRQNPIRFKNQLDEAEERLLAGGLREPEAKQMLEPAQKLLNDRPFWQRQSDGLAVFLSPSVFRCFRLPFNFEELVVVTDRFHIKPLLPLLSGDGRFYVLALSQNELRLLQATRYSVSEVDLEGVPESLSTALRYDVPEESLQWHTSGRAGTGGGRAGVFHGHGVGTDDARHKKNILRYFQKVDNGLSELLGEERSPLVLAGVEYLFPIYREASTYPHLMEEGIAGNPEELSPRELHNRAWATVRPLFLKAQEEAANRYRELAGTEKASAELEKVLPAAYFGRVETLFVALGQQRWGTFDPDPGEIRLHHEAEPGDQDLLDFAAVHTLLNGGTVYALELGEVPDRAPLAAVFRY